MTSLVWGEYTDDDGDVTCALAMTVECSVLQGFPTPIIGTPRRNRFLTPRVEVFSNSRGFYEDLPYPIVYAPHSMGQRITLRGDPTYTKTAQRGEINGRSETP